MMAERSSDWSLLSTCMIVYKTEALLQVVRAAVRDFQDWEITDNETTRCQDVLEQIDQSVLPRDILDETKKVISSAVAIMLTNSGGSLNLEDIKAEYRSGHYRFHAATPPAGYDFLVNTMRECCNLWATGGALAAFLRYALILNTECRSGHYRFHAAAVRASGRSGGSCIMQASLMRRQSSKNPEP
jgi:hypothetical protein